MRQKSSSAANKRQPLKKAGFDLCPEPRPPSPIFAPHFGHGTLKHFGIMDTTQTVPTAPIRLLGVRAGFSKTGVMRDFLIEAQTGEPVPRQMHAQFLHQLAFAGDAVQIADQRNAQQQLGIAKLMCFSMSRSKWVSGT